MRKIPCLRFANLPTPIEFLPQLTAKLRGPQLMVKRDDETGLGLGGNKTRKLEFLLAEAQAHGAKTLITAGAAQSNHCRQTAAAAARYQFKCILVLTGSESEEVTGNLLLDRLFGAEIVWTDREHRDEKLQETFDRAWQDGDRPYLIPYGGSSPTGAAAYAFAMQEMLEQVGDRAPDWVVFASSSGGTQAGLIVGQRLFGYSGKVLGISIDESREELSLQIANLAERTMVLLGEDFPFSPQDTLVNDDYCKAGYGVLGSQEIEAIKLFARLEGLLLDPVYTGRAAAGLIDLIRKGFFSPQESILFWHTGGTPGLFAEKYSQVVESD